MVVRLPHANMVLDPRIIIGTLIRLYKFRFSIEGRTLTITRIDEDSDWVWEYEGFSRVRAYLPTDTIPDFTSTVYTYWGLDDEEAPKDTKEVIFHPSVLTIQMGAFIDCNSLVRVTIPDHVTRIEDYAFHNCNSLKSIQLRRNLERIGWAAISNCASLGAVFLPPTVTYIGNNAFQD